jgi:hypothetical protein
MQFSRMLSTALLYLPASGGQGLGHGWLVRWRVRMYGRTRFLGFELRGMQSEYSLEVYLGVCLLLNVTEYSRLEFDSSSFHSFAYKTSRFWVLFPPLEDTERNDQVTIPPYIWGWKNQKECLPRILISRNIIVACNEGVIIGDGTGLSILPLRYIGLNGWVVPLVVWIKKIANRDVQWYEGGTTAYCIYPGCGHRRCGSCELGFVDEWKAKRVEKKWWLRACRNGRSGGDMLAK